MSLWIRVFLKVVVLCGKKAGKELFKDLYTRELAANYYSITYKTFKGDVVRRSETLKINVARDGEIISWFHNVPEPRVGGAIR